MSLIDDIERSCTKFPIDSEPLPVSPVCHMYGKRCFDRDCKYDGYYRLSVLVGWTPLEITLRCQAPISYIHSSLNALSRRSRGHHKCCIPEEQKAETSLIRPRKPICRTSSVESDYSLRTESAFVVSSIHVCVKCQFYFANGLYFIL